MFEFSHPATDQTPALIDYRYIGNNPYNYIYFNCENLDNQDEETCELWRIIGIFDVDDGTGNYQKRIKIVRNDELAESYQWDENGSNNWPTSTLMEYLNGEYFESLNVSSKNMINDSKYYFSGHKVNNVSHEGSGPYGSAEENYVWERGTEVYSYNKYCQNNDWNTRCMDDEYCIENPTDLFCSNDRPINWIGKIGLLYPSDNFYIYSMGIDNQCFGNTYYCYARNAKNGWLYNNIYFTSNNSQAWFISPVSDTYWNPFNFYAAGYLNGTYGSAGKSYVYPTLYLRTDIYIKSGNGGIDNPYQLSFMPSQSPNYTSNSYDIYRFGDQVIYDNEIYYVLEGCS